MANITVPIQVNLPDDWVEQIVDRLRNDPESEWVEIVRCKDCRHFYEEPADPFLDRCDSTAWYDGDGNDQYVKPTDYCSYAERKEGADG